MGNGFRQPAPSRPELGQHAFPLTVGRYTLYDLLASGGMGSVHYGRFVGPAGFARTVAIKKLHPHLATEEEFVAMLADEARLASRVRHPNVAQTIDVVESDQGFFVVMDYVHGESLARLLKACATQGRSAPPPFVVSIVAGALRGLHAAHEATDESGAPLGLIHRDVSPQNILVGSDGQARVIDFGVAKAAVRLTNTLDGQLKGKLGYMSPEQLQGQPVDRRSDIYAASVVLYEALTGAKLFEGANEGALVGNILQGVRHPPSSRISLAKTIDQRTMNALKELDVVVMRGLANDPRARFQTARDMAVALEAATRVASIDAVEEWVAQMSGRVLSARADVVRRIESDVSRPSLPAPRGSLASYSNMPPPLSPSPTIPPSGRDEQSAVKPMRSRNGSWIVLAALVSLPTLLLVLFAVWRLSERRPELVTTRAITREAPPPAPVAPVATKAPPFPTATAPLPSDAPPGVSAPPIEVDEPPPATDPPSTTSPPHTHHAHGKAATQNKAAPGPVANCDPPYTVDGQGVRIPKPECL